MSDKIITNARLSAELEKYPYWNYAEAYTPMSIKFHDHTGAEYNRSATPLGALTCEIQYWMVQDKITLVTWYNVAHILAAYALYNMQTGKTYSDETKAEIKTFVQSFDSSYADWQIVNTLATFAIHSNSIPYGEYLFNPTVALKTWQTQGASGFGFGKIIAGLGVLAALAK